MYNIKVTAIAAGGAFLLSILLGLIGHSGFLMAFLKALIFGGAFFGLILGICFLYNKFLIPQEDTKKTEGASVGSNLDLTVGDDLPEDDFGDYFSTDQNESQSDDPDEPEELEELEAEDSPLDQNIKEDYNRGSVDVASPNAAPSNEGMMDMGAFIPGIPGIGNDSDDEPDIPRAIPERRINDGTVEMSMGKRPEKTIDFGPDADGKKMAGAIQTLLKKDEG
ncbi:hypothetical protein FACS1894190_06280 [Spirochaetia bacterium]|nr:hypothetical protein FACS1894190_06280 [Spirochaetia bacterium]